MERYKSSFSRLMNHKVIFSKYFSASLTADKCEEIYPGIKPFSEAETASLSKFLNKIKDRLSVYVAFHNYGQALIFPFGYDGEKHENYDEHVCHDFWIRFKHFPSCTKIWKMWKWLKFTPFFLERSCLGSYWTFETCTVDCRNICRFYRYKYRVIKILIWIKDLSVIFKMS